MKKVVTATGETTVFVYAGAQLIAEYSTQASQTPTTSYLTTDHLGSPRVITNAQGSVISRRDFMPYGEDLYAGVGARESVNLKYGTTQDDIRQKFTGYQKDKETQLDFAEARYYNNAHGRFTAVDPLLTSGKSANPQTFNRYVYVGNNPLIRIDPDGEIWIMANKTDRNGVRQYKWIEGNKVPRHWTAIPMQNGSTTFEQHRRGEVIADYRLHADGRRELIRDYAKERAQQREQESQAALAAENRANDPAYQLRGALMRDPRFIGLDRLTNPDGITVGGHLPIPLLNPGGSITLTRNFDIVTSTSFGLDASTLRDAFRVVENNGAGFTNAWKPSGLLGGVSIQATWIRENETDAEHRTQFFEGRSATVSGCLRLCAGVTQVPSENGTRTGYNFGIAASAAPSGGLFFGNGTRRTNPHRLIFGPTVLNGGLR